MMFWLKMAKVPWRGGGHVVVGADGEGEEAAVVGKQLDLHLDIKGAVVIKLRSQGQFLKVKITQCFMSIFSPRSVSPACSS